MLALAIWIGSIAALYGPVVIRMARQWQDDVTYSHGWVIAPIALMLVWRQRDRLRTAPLTPSRAGLAVVIGSLFVFVAGTLAAELFLTRISLIGVLAGTVLYTCGRTHLTLVAFPLLFLVFMIPLPAIVFDRAAVSLQLVASALGERLIRAGGVAVLRDGNVLRLASITLEVDEACSGIRSLMALVSVTTLVGYLFEPIWWRRVAVAVAAVPLAVALNAARIGLTGMAALRYGPSAARGAVHEATGMVVFVVALACVCAVHWRKRPARQGISHRLEAA
jgi:exosortase